MDSYEEADLTIYHADCLPGLKFIRAFLRHAGGKLPRWWPELASAVFKDGLCVLGGPPSVVESLLKRFSGDFATEQISRSYDAYLSSAAEIPKNLNPKRFEISGACYITVFERAGNYEILDRGVYRLLIRIERRWLSRRFNSIVVLATSNERNRRLFPK